MNSNRVHPKWILPTVAAVGLCAGLTGIALQIPGLLPPSDLQNISMPTPELSAESRSFLQPGEMLPQFPESISVANHDSAGDFVPIGDAEVIVVDVWADW